MMAIDYNILYALLMNISHSLYLLSELRMFSEIKPSLNREELIQASKIKAKFCPKLQSTETDHTQPVSSNHWFYNFYNHQ